MDFLVDDQDAGPPDRSTAHVALVCTRIQEIRPLLKQLDRRRRYTDGGQRFHGGFLGESFRVAVVEAGSGFAAHRRASEILMAEHRPRWILSVGFSSSLADDVRPGDLSLATSVCDTHGQRLHVRCPIPESPHVTLRPHLVADSHPVTAAQKRELAAESDAGAVDTVSLAVAQICEESRIPFLSIRAIIDGMDENLPEEAMEAVFGISRQQRSPVSRLLSGWRVPAPVRPWVERTDTAGRRLSRFVQGVVLQLGEHLQRS